MTPNIGSADRLLRAVAAVTLAVIGSVFLGGWLRVLLVIASAVLATTSIFRFCPIYRLAGTGTLRINRLTV